MSSTRTVARNSLWYGVETVFAIASAIATSVLTVRVFGPEVLSYYIFLSLLTTVTGSLGTAGMAMTTRKYMADAFGAGDRPLAMTVFRTALRWQTILAISLASVGIVAALLLARSDYRWIAVVLMLGTIPRNIGFIPAQANMAAENMAANVPGALIGGFLQVAGTLASLAFGWGLLGVAMAQLIGSAVEVAWKLAPLWRQSAAVERPPLPPGLAARMRTFSTQGVGLMLLNLIVWDRSDVLLLQWLHPDPRQITFFSLAVNLVDRMLLVPQTFAGAMGSTIMAEHGRDRGRVAAMTATSGAYLLLIAMPMLLGAAALAQPIWAVYGKAVREAIPVFILVCCFAIPKAVMQPAQNLLQAAERQRQLVWWNFACGLVKFSLGYWLIPALGATGAAIGNGVAQALAGLGAWVLALRLFQMDLRWGKLTSIAGSAAAMGGIVWLTASWLADRPWLAFGAGVPVGVVAFALLLRLTQALDREDSSRLTGLAGALPRPARAPFLKLLAALAPAAPAAAPPIAAPGTPAHPEP